MTRSEPMAYILTDDAAEALALRPEAGLEPLVSQDSGTTPVELLDNFDGSLRRSGRMLLADGASLTLFTRHGVAAQSIAAKGRFVADLPDGPVKRALSDLPALRSLMPIAAASLRRRVLAFVDDDQKTHVRAHLQTLTGGQGPAAVIVTVQGLRGYDGALAEAYAAITTCGGTVLNINRLYTRLFPALDLYDAKPEVAFSANHTAIDAANDIISAYIPVARRNEPGIVADLDTEFLHDYRIALRKVRSVISLFKGVYRESRTLDLKTRFSAFMAATGRLRNLDVYLLDRQKYYALLPPNLHKGLDTTFAMFADERHAEAAKLAQHLQGATYRNDIAELEHLFAARRNLAPGPNAEVRAHDFARSLIWKRYCRIGLIAARIGPETDYLEVHALRIECKKLRYLMEFFASLFPKPAFSALLKPIKILQDNLGLINDCAVQQVDLQVFLHDASRWPKGVDLDVAQSVGALTAALHRRQVAERARTEESLAAFNSPATQQMFKDLFHTAKDKP